MFKSSKTLTSLKYIPVKHNVRVLKYVNIKYLSINYVLTFHFSGIQRPLVITNSQTVTVFLDLILFVVQNLVLSKHQVLRAA
jgi:hypothetical protein